MINTVWFLLILISVFTAAATGKISLISETIFQSAADAIQFTIGLAGAIAFWSGILKVAEAAGITEAIAGIFQPVFTRLFPKLIRHKQIIGLISMTVTANLLGLGNVATPLGLKTMEELQALNTRQERASDDICTFMILVLGGLSILPTTLMAVRARAGSANPNLILIPVFLVSLTGTLFGLVVNGLVLRITRWRNQKK
jgi:spore maturation protein A